METSSANCEATKTLYGCSIFHNCLIMSSEKALYPTRIQSYYRSGTFFVSTALLHCWKRKSSLNASPLLFSPSLHEQSLRSLCSYQMLNTHPQPAVCPRNPHLPNSTYPTQAWAAYSFPQVASNHCYSVVRSSPLTTIYLRTIRRQRRILLRPALCLRAPSPHRWQPHRLYRKSWQARRHALHPCR